MRRIVHAMAPVRHSTAVLLQFKTCVTARHSIVILGGASLPEITCLLLCMCPVARQQVVTSLPRPLLTWKDPRDDVCDLAAIVCCVAWGYSAIMITCASRAANDFVRSNWYGVHARSDLCLVCWPNNQLQTRTPKCCRDKWQVLEAEL